MRSSTSALFKLSIFLVLGTLIFGSCGIIHYSTKESIQFKVNDKEAIGGEDSKYLIYTEEEVFENRDSIWELKWNSSDVYRKVEVGKCYESSAWGFRVSFFSMYRGIDQVQKIKCSIK